MEVMKIMVTSFNRSHALLHSVPPTLKQATIDLCLPQDSWTLTGKSESVSCGFAAPFSQVLVHKVLFVPSKSLFPQSCVSSGSSMAGLMATSSRRSYATPRSAAPRAPSLLQSTAEPYLHKRHSNTVLAQSLWGLWVLVLTRFV